MTYVLYTGNLTVAHLTLPYIQLTSRKDIHQAIRHKSRAASEL